MTTDIKQYKPTTAIYLKNGDIVFTELTVPQVGKMLNDKIEFFVFEDYGGFNKYEVRTRKEYKMNSIQDHILGKPIHIQDILKTREKWKFANLGKGFESVQEVENYLSSKGIINE